MLTTSCHWSPYGATRKNSTHSGNISTAPSNIRKKVLYISAFHTFISRVPLQQQRHVSLCILLSTANINAYFVDTGLPGCFAGWHVLSLQACEPAQQQRCRKLKFRSCCFSNLMKLDDKRESVFTFEQWNSILVYTMIFSIFQHV
jgi:hypothetical protein